MKGAVVEILPEVAEETKVEERLEVVTTTPPAMNLHH